MNKYVTYTDEQIDYFIDKVSNISKSDGSNKEKFNQISHEFYVMTACIRGK